MISRNDKCLCGSNKKYKKCCYGTSIWLLQKNTGEYATQVNRTKTDLTALLVFSSEDQIKLYLDRLDTTAISTKPTAVRVSLGQMAKVVAPNMISLDVDGMLLNTDGLREATGFFQFWIEDTDPIRVSSELGKATTTLKHDPDTALNRDGDWFADNNDPTLTYRIRPPYPEEACPRDSVVLVTEVGPSVLSKSAFHRDRTELDDLDWGRVAEHIRRMVSMDDESRDFMRILQAFVVVITEDEDDE